MPCLRCVEKGLVCEYPSAAFPQSSAAILGSRSPAIRTGNLASPESASTNGHDVSLNGHGIPEAFFDSNLDLQMDFGVMPQFDYSDSNGRTDTTYSDISRNSTPALGSEIYTEKDYAEIYHLRVSSLSTYPLAAS